MRAAVRREVCSWGAADTESLAQGVVFVKGRAGPGLRPALSGDMLSPDGQTVLIQIRGPVDLLKRSRGMYYGWWLAVLGAVIMAAGTVPFFQGMPVWNPVIRARLGWSKDQLVWAFALTRVEGGLLGPLEGLLIDRLGPRRMVLVGCLILGGGFLLFSQVRELWQLYLVFIVMSLGAALGTWLPMMTVMNSWFIRKRTLAMSIVQEGFAVGGVVVPPLMAWSIGGTAVEDPERYGWRATAAAIGLIIMALAFPVSRLVRNRPEDMGLAPDGAAQEPRRPETAQAGPSAYSEMDYTWRQAIRTKAFWFIGIGHGASSIVIVTIMVHLGLMLDDRGFSLGTIGLVVSAYTGLNAVFVLVGGYVGSRVPMRYALFGFSALQSGAVAVLLLAGDDALMVFLFAVLLGIGFGGRNPLSSAIRGAYFGRKDYATITGLGMVIMNVFLFTAPVVAGYISYDIAFGGVGVVCLLGSGLFLFLGDPKPPPPAPRPQVRRTGV